MREGKGLKLLLVLFNPFQILKGTNFQDYKKLEETGGEIWTNTKISRDQQFYKTFNCSKKIKFSTIEDLKDKKIKLQNILDSKLKKHKLKPFQLKNTFKVDPKRLKLENSTQIKLLKRRLKILDCDILTLEGTVNFSVDKLSIFRDKNGGDNADIVSFLINSPKNQKISKIIEATTTKNDDEFKSKMQYSYLRKKKQYLLWFNELKIQNRKVSPTTGKSKIFII